MNTAPIVLVVLSSLGLVLFVILTNRFKDLRVRLDKLNKEINSKINELSKEPEEYVYHQRIVSAANLYPDGSIILGARHFDELMHKNLEAHRSAYQLADYDAPSAIQGFIDQHCCFYTREEAWVIAEKANQILHRCGGDTIDGGRLFSENLY